MKSLKLEIVLGNLKSRLDHIDVNKLSGDQKILYEKHLRQLEKWWKKYTKLSREWEGLREEIEETRRDMEKGEITYEQFSAIRVRRSKALRTVGQQLIDFQEELKRDFVPELLKVLTNLEEKKT